MVAQLKCHYSINNIRSELLVSVTSDCLSDTSRGDPQNFYCQVFSKFTLTSYISNSITKMSENTRVDVHDAWSRLVLMS